MLDIWQVQLGDTIQLGLLPAIINILFLSYMNALIIFLLFFATTKQHIGHWIWNKKKTVLHFTKQNSTSNSSVITFIILILIPLK